MPIFRQKHVHYLKSTMLSCHLFQFFHEKPLLSYPYLVKKHQFCQNYTILWDKKVNRIPVLLIFHQKITALMPDFCLKNAHSLKNTSALMPIFYRKIVNFLKNTLLPCNFSQILHEKTPAVMPIFGPKNVNSVKNTLYFGP